LQSCVTKHGNPRLRAALVELAWRLVRFQPNYRGVRKWKERLAKGALTTGAARKKAIVALARQLAIDLWRIRTGRLSPESARIKIYNLQRERRRRFEGNSDRKLGACELCARDPNLLRGLHFASDALDWAPAPPLLFQRNVIALIIWVLRPKELTHG
jgi:hypothetical protein